MRLSENCKRIVRGSESCEIIEDIIAEKQANLDLQAMKFSNSRWARSSPSSRSSRSASPLQSDLGQCTPTCGNRVDRLIQDPTDAHSGSGMRHIKACPFELINTLQCGFIEVID